MNTQLNHPAIDIYMVRLCEAIDPEKIAAKLSAKRPTIKEAIKAITLLMSDEITEDFDIKAEMIFAYMLQSRLSPIPFEGVHIIDYLDEVSDSRIERFLSAYSEFFGADPSKDEYESWKEDEEKRNSYFRGEA
jgi:hypothetical protein